MNLPDLKAAAEGATPRVDRATGRTIRKVARALERERNAAVEALTDIRLGATMMKDCPTGDQKALNQYAKEVERVARKALSEVTCTEAAIGS